MGTTKSRQLKPGETLDTRKSRKGTLGKNSKEDLKLHKWWNADDEEMYEACFNVASIIAASSAARRRNHVEMLWAYDPRTSAHNSTYGGSIGSYRVSPVNAPDDGDEVPLVQNVITRSVDAIGNKLFHNVPVPMALPLKGNGRLQRQAERLTQALQGLHDASGFTGVTSIQSGFTALKLGTAFNKFYYDADGKLHSENVYPNDVLIDQLDGRKQRPRQMHHMAPVDREQLKAMFPDKDEFLDRAGLGPFEMYKGRSATDDVLVLESWHLPSSEEAGDGRHCWSVDTGTLKVEPWEHTFFPFAVLRFKETETGFWGTGVVHDMYDEQRFLDKLTWAIDQNTSRMCKGKWMIPADSDVDPKDLDEIGGSVIYAGEHGPPTSVSPDPLSDKVFTLAASVKQDLMETPGTSQLMIGGSKPTGLDSGVALETYHDIESERFSVFGKSFERFIVDASKIVTALTREQAELDKKFTVKTPGPHMQEIKWKDVDLDDRMIELRVFPINDLPSTPAGRRQELTSMVESGWVDRTYAMSLLNMPDMDSFTHRMTAILDRMNDIIERILDDEEEDIRPDQYLLGGIDGPKLIYAILNAEINRAHVNNESENAINLLDKFVNDCHELEALSQATPAPAPVAAPAAPVGGPLAPGAPPPAPVAQLAGAPPPMAAA